jgi:hypothetical protein
MNKKILGLIVGAIVIVLAVVAVFVFTNKDETEQTIIQPTNAPSPTTPSITNNEEISGLVEKIDEAKEEISKNNKLTEEEMLSIGREIRKNSMKDFYNLNNDADLDAYLIRYFIDEEPHYKAYKEGYPAANEKYSKGEVKLEDEKVEHYGETGFVYTVRETQTVYLADGSGQASLASIVTMNVDIDDDGKYKIAAETTELAK